MLVLRMDICEAQKLLTEICWKALRMLGAYISTKANRPIQPVGSFHCLRVLADLRHHSRNNDHILHRHRFRISTLLSHLT